MAPCFSRSVSVENRNDPGNFSPLLLITGGIGQVLVGFGVAQQVAPNAAASSHLVALITIVPGAILGVAGLLQIVSNHLTKQKRIEIETRLKRLEMGLPCEDNHCPVQKIANRKPIPPIFGATKAAKPDDDTVDVP